MKTVTLGMCCYDDFDGVYFSCQANRLLHPILERSGEILVVDNNPTSVHGHETQKFCRESKFVRYIPYDEKVSTSVRNKVFEFAESEIVICIDCHVLLLPNAVEAVIEFFEEQWESAAALVFGPIVQDCLKTESREMFDVFKRGLNGIWSPPEPIDFELRAPQQIDMMGLGAFAARKSQWPGFSRHFRGYGGEEHYITHFYRQLNGRTVALPTFKWLHRFGRTNGDPYVIHYNDRVFNSFIGCFELGQSPDRIIEYYNPILGQWRVKQIFDQARRACEN